MTKQDTLPPLPELRARFQFWYGNDLLAAPVHQSREDRQWAAFQAGARAALAAQAPPPPACVWAVENKVSLTLFASKADAEAFVGSFPMSVSGGLQVSAMPVLGAPQQAQGAPMVYSLDADPAGIRKRVAWAIDGALGYGQSGTDPAPEGHWLKQFWEYGREAGQWRELFWSVARALGCLPSRDVDGNAHVFRKAEEFAAAFEAAPQQAQAPESLALGLLCGLAGEVSTDDPMTAAERIFDHVQAERAAHARELENYQRNLEGRDAVISSLRATIKQAQAPGWQDIETAPKDGRTVQLGYFNSHGKWRSLRGQWMSADYIAEFWEDPDDGEPGWYETSVEKDDTPNCWRTEPTHWAPLLSAPQQGDKTP